jgi:hypothetical protein
VILNDREDELAHKVSETIYQYLVDWALSEERVLSENRYKIRYPMRAVSTGRSIVSAISAVIFGKYKWRRVCAL